MPNSDDEINYLLDDQNINQKMRNSNENQLNKREDLVEFILYSLHKTMN